MLQALPGVIFSTLFCIYLRKELGWNISYLCMPLPDHKVWVHKLSWKKSGFKKPKKRLSKRGNIMLFCLHKRHYQNRGVFKLASINHHVPISNNRELYLSLVIISFHEGAFEINFWWLNPNPNLVTLTESAKPGHHFT